MSIRNGQADRQPRLLVHRAGVPRRRADLVVRRPLLRPRRAAARRGAAADRDRGRGAQGRVAHREAGRAARAAQEGRGAASRSAATAASWSSWPTRTRPRASRPGATRAPTRSSRSASCSGGSSCTRLPRVIECYDVSHLQGFATVASMVVFVDGRPDKSRYRTYKVRAPARPAAAATTTTSPRCTRCSRGASGARAKEARTPDTWKLPDLIVVDGGKGQLAMALAAARDVGIDMRPGVGLPIVALAKERDVALEEGPGAGLDEGRAEGAEARREGRRRTGDAIAAPSPVEVPAAAAGAAGGQEAGPRRRQRDQTGSRLSPARQGRHPDPQQQRRDVRPAAAARRGPPLRHQLPPQPAAASHAPLGALGRSRASARAASASCCATSAASSGSARRRSTSWPPCRG